MAGLFARVRGSGGPAVVLVHGFGGSHEVWAPVMDALEPVATIHACDLPGHGESLDFPGGGPPKVAVAAILDDLAGRGITRFHVAGHSMGGAIGALIALAAPERVASLTLLAPGGFGPEINVRLLRRFAAARTAGDLEMALEGMTGFLNPVAAETVAYYCRHRARPGQTETLIRLAEGLARDGRQGVIPRDRLAALAMPARVIWGVQDNVLPARQAENLPGNVEATLLAETGHMLVEEAPDAVIATLRRQISA